MACAGERVGAGSNVTDSNVTDSNATDSDLFDTRVIDSSTTDTATSDAGTDIASDVSTDVRADAGPDVADATPPCQVPGNLVVNGSFENGATIPTGWNDPNLSSNNGGAADCARWVTFAPTVAWARFGQLGHHALEAGDVIEIGAYIRSLDGNTEPAEVFFSGTGGDFYLSITAPLSGTGWYKAQGTHRLTTTVTEFTVGVGAALNGPRTLGVDNIWFRVVPGE